MSRKYDIKGIIFDLDGTLLNTLEDIADAENSALKEFGLPSRPVDDYRLIVGGGAENIASKLLPESMQTEQMIMDFVDCFRFYYHQNWHNKTHLYNGIADLLKTLLDRKLKLAVLSNKPEEFAIRIVEHYFPDWVGKTGPAIFTHVIGQRKGFPAKPNPEAALYIAEDWKFEPESCGLVGDSDIDMLTAQNAGMVAIGAEWGFRGKEELEQNGADILLQHPLELIQHIIRD